MKKILLSLSAFALGCISILAQTATFTTDGKNILDPCGNVFVIRGVNYSLADDWNFPGNLNTGGERSSEIIKANPNTVRIQWYVDYGQPARPALTLTGLDSVISRFARAGIVSVLEIHDFTHIHTDTTAFNNEVMAWWTSAPVLALIEKHKRHLLLNVANEYGPAMYPADLGYTLNPNYATQVTVWATHYKSCITRLRQAGITVPIVIDAPNYGMDHNAVIAHGQAFAQHDPLNRIIMSNHAYWNDNAIQMAQKVTTLSALTVPVFLGEVGNVDFACSPIQMHSLLTACQDENMGWLSWTWNRDECAVRNMTANQTNPSSVTDGRFSSLTSYGDTIVNSATYGLANHAVKADFSCPVSIGENLENTWSILIYPNPSSDVLYVELPEPFLEGDLHIVDIQGRVVETRSLYSKKISVDVSGLPGGIYVCRIVSGGNVFSKKFLKMN